MTQTEWKKSTNLVFWGVILLSFSGIISTLFDYLSTALSFIEMASKWLPNLPVLDFLGEIKVIGLSSKSIVVIGYALYLFGLTRFASALEGEAGKKILKVRTGVIVLIIAFLLDLVFGVLAAIPVLGLPLRFFVWVLMLVAYYKMRNGFAYLTEYERFCDKAKRGSRNLRYAAVCNINLLYLPLVVWMLMLLLVAFTIWLMASTVSDGVNVMESTGNSLSFSGFLALVILVFVFVLFVIWSIGAFIFPIIGWYRIKSCDKEYPQEEQLCYDTETIETTAPNEPSMVTADTALDVGQEQESDSKKKLYYIVGGIAAIVMIAFAIFLFKGCGGSSGLLGLEKPQWENFVVIDAEGVFAQKEAKDDSPRLMVMQEAEEECAEIIGQFRWEDEGKKRGYTIDIFRLYKEQVYPVLEESGEWYKVRIEDWIGTTDAYIKKKYCKEVKPKPITEEVLRHIEKEFNYVCFNIVRDGKYNNLCLRSKGEEYEGGYDEFLRIGEIIDGVLFFPDYSPIYLLKGKDEGINISTGADDDALQITYGPGDVRTADGITSYVFDPQRLNEEMLEKLYNKVKEEHPISGRVAYYFPDVDRDRLFEFSYSLKPDDTTASLPETSSDEESKVTGYHTSERGESQVLIAEFGSAYENTGIELIGPIIAVDDFDDDGNADALVQNGFPGSSGVYHYQVVYFDVVSDKFKTAEDEVCVLGGTPDIEDWEGKKSLVVRAGILMERYALINGVLKKVESTTASVGSILVQITKDQLFSQSSEEYEERERNDDIDGDGITEGLVFSHDLSHPYIFGAAMKLESITWPDGRVISKAALQNVYAGESFAFLEHMTKGLPDILVSDQYLFQWNGSAYEMK